MPSIDGELDRATNLRRRNRDLSSLHLQALLQRCPSPRVRGLLGLDEHAAQHWRVAYTLLRETLASTGDAWVTAQRVLLERALSEVQEHLPRLSPQTNVPGAELRVNGEVAGSLPLSLPYVLASGSASLELSAVGHRTLRRTVSLADGEVFREMLTLEVSGASASAPSRPTEPTAPTTPVAIPATVAPTVSLPQSLRPPPVHGPGAGPWIVVGAGAALFGLGGVFWALRGSAIGNCDVESNAIACPSPTDAARAEGAAGMGLAANASLGVGAAAIAGGLLWALLGRSGGERPTTAMRLNVSPVASGSVVSLEGSF